MNDAVESAEYCHICKMNAWLLHDQSVPFQLIDFPNSLCKPLVEVLQREETKKNTGGQDCDSRQKDFECNCQGVGSLFMS
jgi:hypothetical protein